MNLSPGKVLEKFWKSPRNLFLKKGTNPVLASSKCSVSWHAVQKLQMNKMGEESQKEKLRLSCFASLSLTVLLLYFLVTVFLAAPRLTEYL